MRFAFIGLLIQVTIITSYGQNFEFGKITYKDLEMTTYDRDSTAEAVVLKEYGEAYIQSGGDYNLIFEHHYVIKILKQSAVERATITIPLYKGGEMKERIVKIKASSYCVKENRIVETKVGDKDFFLTNYNKDADLEKFAIPNVSIGSIIEVQYELESPFFYRNFRTWEFQDDIPKVSSEYWARIPGNYLYNISLAGLLKLESYTSELIEDCFSAGAGKSNCALYKFRMKNVPAFIEENYMTASSNFLSAVEFELMEVRYFDGRIDKVTTEWKDADQEMRKDPRFGLQLKKGKDIEEKIEPLIRGVMDEKERATIIYNFIRDWFTWNNYFGKYCELGIKKAFESRKGNIGDINLSLISALANAGLQVEPMILSTRENGLPKEIFPVLSDFNYVVAKLNIGAQVFLLDASDPYLPFGLLPERCLNGKGRVFGDEPSYWYDLKPAASDKTTSFVTLSLDSIGKIYGTIVNRYSGYKAYKKRREILSATSQKEYVDKQIGASSSVQITSFEFTGLQEIGKDVEEKLTIQLEDFSLEDDNSLLLNPFLTTKVSDNPFKSTERFYPVDFGAPLEINVTLVLNHMGKLKLMDVPAQKSLVLPYDGGKFLYKVSEFNDKTIVSQKFTITKSVYSSQEYHYLKELFSSVVQVNNTDLYYKK